MSGRCVCCNAVLLRTTGKRKLEDGSFIEETFCNVCRNEVNKIEKQDELVACLTEYFNKL